MVEAASSLDGVKIDVISRIAYANLLASAGVGLAIAYTQLLVPVEAGFLAISLLTTAYYGFHVIGLNVFGKLLDRAGGKALPIVFIGLLVVAVINVLLPFFENPLQLGVLRAVQGLFWAAFIPATSAMVTSLSTPVFRGRAMGIYNRGASIGMLLGFFVGGFLADALSFKATFLMGALLVGVSAVTLIMSRPKAGFNVLDEETVKSTPSISTPRIVTPSIAPLYLCLFLRHTGAGGIWALFSVYLSSLGASKTQIGFIYAVNLVTQTAFMVQAGKLSDRFGRKITLTIALLLSALTFIAYALAPNAYLIVPVQVVLGVSWSMLITSSTALAGDLAPSERRAEVMGRLFTALSLGSVVGPVISGFVSSVTGIRIYMVLAAIQSLAASIVASLIKEPNIKSIPSGRLRANLAFNP
ncbi:MAG: MFS transporter [Candidatus Nezhaarchaeales archaeon]